MMRRIPNALYRRAYIASDIADFQAALDARRKPIFRPDFEWLTQTMAHHCTTAVLLEDITITSISSSSYEIRDRSAAMTLRKFALDIPESIAIPSGIYTSRYGVKLDAGSHYPAVVCAYSGLRRPALTALLDDRERFTNLIQKLKDMSFED